MPRPREYATPAAREAASRKRKEDDQGRLQAALWRLDTAVWDAGGRGDALAMACRSGKVLTMLDRLVKAFEQRPAAAEDPA